VIEGLGVVKKRRKIRAVIDCTMTIIVTIDTNSILLTMKMNDFVL